MNVAFNRRHNDFAIIGFFGRASSSEVLRFLCFDERDEIGHSLFHDARTFDNLRQEHLARAKQVADNVHACHQGAFDNFEGLSSTIFNFFAGFFGVAINKIGNAAD